MDSGVMCKPKTKDIVMRADQVDGNIKKDDDAFVIPTLADLLIMYSTSDGYYSFRNPDHGSWFIQALCAELKKKRNAQQDLLSILTDVNRRVAFRYQSNAPKNLKLDACKQMPNIISMLTKKLYLPKKLGN